MTVATLQRPAKPAAPAKVMRRFILKIGQHIDNDPTTPKVEDLKGLSTTQLKEMAQGLEIDTEGWEDNRKRLIWAIVDATKRERVYQAGDGQIIESDDPELVNWTSKFEQIHEQPIATQVITLRETEKRPDESDSEYKARMTEVLKNVQAALADTNGLTQTVPAGNGHAPAAKVVPTPAVLNGMSVKQLAEFAAEEEIDLSKCGNDKAKIVQAIIAATK